MALYTLASHCSDITLLANTFSKVVILSGTVSRNPFLHPLALNSNIVIKQIALIFFINLIFMTAILLVETDPKTNIVHGRIGV